MGTGDARVLAPSYASHYWGPFPAADPKLQRLGSWVSSCSNLETAKPLLGRESSQASFAEDAGWPHQSSSSGHGKYRRPHLLDITIDTIEVDPATMPAAMASWHEVSRCFLSLHPRSGRLPGDGSSASLETFFPDEVPQETLQGQYLVSQPTTLRKAVSDGEGVAGRPVLVARPGEGKMTLKMARLHALCILYLWCRRSSLFGEESMLLGWRALPLRDDDLNGRLATWDILHAESGEQVAEVRMRCSVASTPGPIRLPLLEKASADAAELRWSPPLVDGGRPVLGYSIQMFDTWTNKWLQLCDCAPSTGYELPNLAPTQVYTVSICAVNEVGLGEPWRLEVHTDKGHTECAATINSDSDASSTYLL